MYDCVYFRTVLHPVPVRCHARTKFSFRHWFGLGYADGPIDWMVEAPSAQSPQRQQQTAPFSPEIQEISLRLLLSSFKTCLLWMSWQMVLCQWDDYLFIFRLGNALTDPRTNLKLSVETKLLLIQSTSQHIDHTPFRDLNDPPLHLRLALSDRSDTGPVSRNLSDVWTFGKEASECRLFVPVCA